MRNRLVFIIQEAFGTTLQQINTSIHEFETEVQKNTQSSFDYLEERAPLSHQQKSLLFGVTYLAKTDFAAPYRGGTI